MSKLYDLRGAVENERDTRGPFEPWAPMRYVEPAKSCVYRISYTLCNRTTVDKLFIADDMEQALVKFHENRDTGGYKPDNVEFVGRCYR